MSGGAAPGGGASSGSGAALGATASTGSGPDEIRSRIDAGYADLTPQERRAADFMIGHLADLAVFSATEIADGSDVSKATVSRLFRRLGYTDAHELRDQARAARSQGVPVGESGDLVAHLVAEHGNLEAMLRGLADGRLDRAAALLAGARRVVVAGYRNSYPVALHLREQLAQGRDGVALAPAPGQSVAEEVAGLTEVDAVVLVGFRRRPAGFAALVAAVEAQGVPLVLITEAAGGVDAATTIRLVVPLGSAAPFDSYAAAMSLVNLLASAALATGGEAARAHVAAITALYADLGELE